MIVFLCPGQGAQTPGFLTPWLEDRALAESLTELSESAQTDLLQHGTVSDADTIRDTRIAQPLIVAASLLSYQALQSAMSTAGIALDAAHTGVVGHSVGEFAAAAISGTLTNAEAVSLVRERSSAMAEAAAATPTSMSAVLGGDQETVIQAMKTAGVYPANFNGGGQIVAAGSFEHLEEFKNSPPQGTRIIPLQVAGAFHTPYMESAIPHLRSKIADVQPKNPTINLWTNKDGSRVTDGADFVNLMVEQISSPVRWDLNMATLANLEAAGLPPIKGVIELSPAGTLVGLCRRGLPGIPSVALKTPEDINKALELIAS